MPADIRSFFGGKPAAAPEKASQSNGNGTEAKAAAKGTKRKSKSRVILEDDSDEEPVVETKKATPKKLPAKKSKPEAPKGEETTSTDYFASTKPSQYTRITPVKAKAVPMSKNGTDKTAAGTPTRGSARKQATKKSYVELDDEDAFLDDEQGGNDDIFAADAAARGRRKDDGYMEIDSDDEPVVVPKRVTSRAQPHGKTSKKAAKSESPVISLVDDEDEDVVMVDRKSKAPAARSTKKRKSVDSDDEESNGIDQPTKASKAKSPSKKAPAKKKAKNEDRPESAAIKAIFDSIPTVRPPSPPPKDPDAKFDWRKGGGGNAGPPPAAGTKEIPVGAENCLAGLTFVFTGLLETISREEGQELVKKYGGKITGAPSGKTSFVVLGSDAGPSKLEKIKKLSIKTIDEDGLLALIRSLPANGGDGKNAEKYAEKQKADEEKIRLEALEMEKEEKKRAAAAEKEAVRVAAARGLDTSSSKAAAALKSQLWTTKYAPTSLNQICGNKGQVLKIQKWLADWPKNHKINFQKRGPDGTGAERAIMIYGPPGIGKTTAAHLAAKLEGYDVIEYNASNTRSKKLVEHGLGDVLNNKSLSGFFAADGLKVDEQKKKIVLIMDEVDGMSAGDRGGVGALAKICKTTDIPLILICNDRKSQKMKPFNGVAIDIPFKRPQVAEVRSRIATICAREGLKIPPPVIDALVEGTNKDIRQVINMLSTAKLDQTAMDFEGGKAMSKSWEKHIVLKPWDICAQLLGGGMFAPSSKKTLNDKIELYFNDHEFSYLMIQENYLSTKPILANQAPPGRAQRMKILELADKAAESISDGDLVDRMIHGSQQQWSLMPVHGVFSAVRPASYMSGMITGETRFTSWLGNNSKYGKLTRYVKEIQSHMRLRTSGDRHEIRQQYLPVLWDKTVNTLQTKGKESVDGVIDIMDSYFLTKDDFDYIQELGVGPQDESHVKIETQTKATFTRLYNQKSHPMPFMKASNVMAPSKSSKVIPDLEEAIEEEDVEELVVEEKEDDGEIDFKKDKFIQKPGKKKAPAKKKAAGKKGKPAKTAEEDEDEDLLDDFIDSGEDTQPKKKARAKAPAKGKGKK